MEFAETLSPVIIGLRFVLLSATPDKSATGNNFVGNKTSLGADAKGEMAQARPVRDFRMSVFLGAVSQQLRKLSCDPPFVASSSGGRRHVATRRCAQRMYLLRPDKATKKAVFYCLAEAASKFRGIRIMWLFTMSNHLLCGAAHNKCYPPRPVMWS